MKSVPLPVSGPSPWSEMISEAPGDISSEIRSSASGGMLTRSSASVAFDAGRGGAGGGWTCLPLADFLAGADPVPGIDTTFQRSVVLSSLAAKAVKTAPCELRLLREAENPWYEITLVEGRNRQIRRMFEQVGHHVEKIKRVRFGPLVLNVETGEYRELSSKEVGMLKSPNAAQS